MQEITKIDKNEIKFYYNQKQNCISIYYKSCFFGYDIEYDMFFKDIASFMTARQFKIFLKKFDNFLEKIKGGNSKWKKGIIKNK